MTRPDRHAIRATAVPGYDLQRRLDEAEATIQALLSGQIDAVVDVAHGTPVLLAKAQEALKESEERYREQAALLDIAHEAIMVKDLDGRILYWNKGAENTFGWSAAEALGRKAEEFLHVDPIGFHNARRVLLATGVWKGEHARLTKGGHVVVVESGWTLVRDSKGQPKSILAIHTDMTERRQAVEASQAADERMRFALASAHVGIWDMDWKTGTLRWSATLEAQYGAAPGTFEGTFEAVIARIHPDDRAAVLGVFDEATKSGGEFTLRHRVLWPDGTTRWLSGAGRILLDDAGAPLLGVGISQDVTEQHTLQEQFLQAQKMEAIGRLAGGVAHDFNNLLTVILGFCELLLDDADSLRPRRADIEEIQKAGIRAAGLTRQLLAFSRKQIIEPTRLDLNVVITDMQAMLERLIGEDVDVLLNLTPALAGIMADRGQVEQIVMNLAVNARDAMSNGGTLTIATNNADLDCHNAAAHAGMPPGPHVALTVSDTGTGMSPEVQARLFEPFFTTKEVGKGTGLGLATVQGIVARSGGHISVHSAVGSGTAFTVCFPPTDAVERVADAPTPVAARTGPVTVLVVEDADGLRLLIARILQRKGYAALVAAHAEEALRLFDENPSIDVLLTDVVMPGSSGPELTRDLLKRRPSLKVVYMSGYTDEAIVHHGVLEPGIIFLHKPFTAQALMGKIREALEGS